MSQWEKDLTCFVRELDSMQKEVLDVLERNQKLLTKVDAKGIEKISQEELQITEKLQTCLVKREKLLQYAKAEQLPSENLESLAKHVIPDRKSEFYKLFEQVKHQTRHIHLYGMTNWIITQKSINHTSQMLEIIATGGRGKPTYTRKHNRHVGVTGGAIVDKKA